MAVSTLCSCEGYFRFRGQVLDAKTKKQTDNVNVFFVLKRRDTMTLYNRNLLYDSLNQSERLSRRTKGQKDDYTGKDENGFYRLAPELIDQSGHFDFGTQIVPCIPKCPTGTLTFRKNGYKPFVIPITSLWNDSLIVYMTPQSDSD